MNICHCSMCRKSSGSSYGTFVHVPAEHFQWGPGVEQVAKYESSPGEFRAFCKTCGSNMPVADAENEYVCIPAGTLDDDPGIRPMVQLFAASKAPWHVLTDTPEHFDEFEPDDFWDQAEKHKYD